jgi:hypothetical protein
MDVKAAIAAFNRHYPTFLRFLHGLGDVLVATSQTFLVAFGVPVVLILLLIVEHNRVKHGIALFEVDAGMASFAAWSLVLLNTILEFTIHYIESKNGYQPERQRRASLRLYLQSLAYWFGFSRHWQPVELSPAYRYRKLLRLITFSILALALAGSMQAAILQQTGAWYVALGNIITQSTLQEMTVWAGGLLFALAAISGAQNLTAYLAVKVTEVTPDESAAQIANPLQDYAARLIDDLPEIQPVTHFVECEKCGWSNTYDNERSANMGLNAHLRHCTQKHELSPNGKH